VLEVWAFELQQTDQRFKQVLRARDGLARPALHVEIRAMSISGPLKDGDKVEVRGTISGGTLYAHNVTNWSSQGARVTLAEWAGVP
jgi:hypothetical protein